MYNGGDLSNDASVSSYSGIMIVGDTYGQNSMGDYDADHSSYEKLFEAAQIHWIRLYYQKTLKAKYICKCNLLISLSKQESQCQLEFQIRHRNIDMNPGNASKQNV